MGYSLQLTAGVAAQNEGNPGGTAGTWTYTLTRDIDLGQTAYSFHVFNADTTPSNDLNGGAADGTFTWAPGAVSTTVTFTAVADITVESNENPVIWFYKGSTPIGVNILSNQDVAANVITLVNDDTGAPVFSSPAAISVAENLTAVATVAAASGSTTLTYALTGGADLGKFAIDSGTGALTFLTAKNFEAPDDAGANGVYNVTVTASGGGASTTQDLVITLANANEAPVITSNGGGDTATGVPSVGENTLTPFLTAAATDPDAGDVITWSIAGGADSSFFAINPTTGALSLAHQINLSPTSHPDAGGNDVYDVIIQATDAGGLLDTQALAVTVTSQNDAPIITSYGGVDPYILHAPENTATTTGLVTVTATDEESDAIVFSKTGPDAGSFNIDAATGVLTFGTSPDYEQPSDANGDNVFDVTVVATAAGQTDTQEFLIFLDNVVEAGESGGGGGGFVVPGGGGGGGVVAPPKPSATPTAGDDSIVGNFGQEYIAGGAGNDTIDGAGGNDSIDGDAGNDSIQGGDGSDFLRGLADNDVVFGGAGDDTVNGNLGDDTVSGDDGADTVYGGQGNDNVAGGAGDDPYVNGNIGADTVHGEAGNDSVYGGQGNDSVYGDDGNDRVSGDLGDDNLFGGDGADRFAFQAGFGHDWVIDFNFTAGDRILLLPGTTYTLSAYEGQAVLTLAGGDTIALAGVPASLFTADYVVFGA